VLFLDLWRYQCKVAPMYLYGKPVQCVNSVKYLGVTLTCMLSKKISFDLNQVRRKFWGVNLILSLLQWWYVCGETAFSIKLLLSDVAIIMLLNVLHGR